jgi:hypothetical protein
MVDGPMMFEKAHLEICRNLRRAITIDVGNQTRGVREKIRGVEIEDGRKGIGVLHKVFGDASALRDIVKIAMSKWPYPDGKRTGASKRDLRA